MATDFDISRAAARVYSQALLDLASEQGQADAVGEEMAALSALWDREPAFAALMSSAAIDEDARAASIKNVFAARVSPLVFNLLMVLNRKRRTMILRHVAESYRHLLDRMHGRDDVFVTSAIPLKDDQRKWLVEWLRGKLKVEPVLVERVDPDILGGITIQAADRIVDVSVRKRIGDMRSALRAASDRRLREAGTRFVKES